MAFSILVTTYNGAPYIIEQLDSLRFQTEKPDEVLIFDDCSTDDTARIVTDYIAEFHLPWVFRVNARNLGWKKNFMQGLEKARGDFVFLCDQDDIWAFDKCARMISLITGIPSCNLLMANYQPLVMDESSKTQLHLRHQCDNRKVEKIHCTEKNLLVVMRPGCTYCIRKSFFTEMKGYYQEGIPHDEFLYVSALLTDSLYLFNFHSIRFRRHEGSNSPSNRHSVEGREKIIAESQLLFESLLLQFRGNRRYSTRAFKGPLISALAFCNYRYRYFSRPSFLVWVHLALVYHKDYLSLKSLFGDFYIGLLCHSNRNEVLGLQ
jgi:glycosyltransferase involved in cell wall biosynthesis